MASANDRTLEAIRLLAVLPPEVRHQLEAMCRWRRFVRNEEILGLQDRSRDVFMVVRGRVRVGIQSVGGRQIAIEERSEGGHFGEIEAIDGGPRCAGVIALTRATLAVISGSLFVDLCRRYPDFALAVMQDMARNVRYTTNRVVALSTLGAYNRVHAELLHLAQSTPNGGGTLMIRPAPHHGELAARVGTARETVARALAELARKRVVERQGDALVVRDPNRLAAMVEDVWGTQNSRR